MADNGEPERTARVVSLEDAIREVKIMAADRGDVVVDLREAAHARLELLVQELTGTIQSVPEDDDQFDFALSSGQNPRFFIDAVSHVGLGRDRLTYRFLRDTRAGRIVVDESRDIKTIADRVTRYVAERIVERQRMMEGPVEPALRSAEAPAAPAAHPHAGMSDFVLGLIWFIIGAVAGIGFLYVWLMQGHLLPGAT